MEKKDLCTQSVKWGIIDRHPFKGEVKLEGVKPRDRYIDDWEIVEALQLSSPRSKGSVKVIQSFIRIALITGMRRNEILQIEEKNISKDGIRVYVGKQKKKFRTIRWNDQLKQEITNARKIRPVHISPYLFCNRYGKPYINPDTGVPEGFKSMWQRFMDRLIKETKIKERFTMHDLRAKCASDAESLERAQEILNHADQQTTKRVYRRKPEVIEPQKLNLNRTNDSE